MSRRTLYAAVIGAFLLLPGAVFAQQNTVLQGIVRSNTQAPIAGAMVHIQGLNLTRVTNVDGRYQFDIPAAAQTVTVQVSSIGFGEVTQTVALRPGVVVQDFMIAQRAIQLDELVVTGLAGQQERRASGTVVASVKAAEIAQVAPITSVANLLQGRTPGVVLRNSSGTTGTSQTIRIRGLASMNGSNDPLVFIDGIRMDAGNRLDATGGQQTNALNDIKIEEIENIEIVKGPAAATLYGADAAAGVINIVTKRGRASSGFVQSITMEYGRAAPNFDPYDNWGECHAQALANPSAYPACVGLAQGTILSDNPLKRDPPFIDGTYRNISYQLSGGSDNYGIFFHMGVDDDQGTLPNNEYGHISSRANFFFMPRENLKLDIGFGISRVKTQLPNNDNNIYGFLGGGFLGDPRTVGGAKDGWYASNRHSLAIGSIETVDATTRFQPRFEITYSPFSWFTNRLLAGADMNRLDLHQFWAKNDGLWWDDVGMNTGQITIWRNLRNRYTAQYSGTVMHRLTDDLHFSLAFGAEAMANMNDGANVTGRGFVNNVVRNISAAAEIRSASQSASESRQIGTFAQAQFSLLNRIYLTTGVRRDQLSSFGIDSKPFYSPSANVSYVISDEPFFQNLMDFLPDGSISTLKLRTAYGVAGRQPSSGARSTYSPATNQIAPTGAVAVGVRPGATGNPLLTAERSSEFELGFDAGLLNDRLGIELTYFRKNMFDQIGSLPVPPSVGASAPQMNLGKMRNTGIEIGTNARLITRENVTLDVNASLQTLNNVILDLAGVTETATLKVGYPRTAYWDYEIKSIDLENNLVIVSDSLRPIGNGTNYPGWTAAWGGTLRLFQNLSFYTQFESRGDYIAYDATNQFRDRSMGSGEAAVRGAAAFGTNADGTPTDQARREYLSRFGPFRTEDGRNLNRTLVDGGYAQDGGFISLREISANYQIPLSIAQRYLRVRGASFGLSMRNLKTWTDFSGYDPETSTLLTVPQARRWTARFNFTF